MLGRRVLSPPLKWREKAEEETSAAWKRARILPDDAPSAERSLLDDSPSFASGAAMGVCWILDERPGGREGRDEESGTERE